MPIAPDFKRAAHQAQDSGSLPPELVDDLGLLVKKGKELESAYFQCHKARDLGGQQDARTRLSEYLEINRETLNYALDFGAEALEVEGWSLIRFLYTKHFYTGNYQEAMSLALRAVKMIEAFQESGDFSREDATRLLGKYRYDLSRFESSYYYTKQQEDSERENDVDEYEWEEISFGQ
jgi:hypothetical protein